MPRRCGIWPIFPPLSFSMFIFFGFFVLSVLLYIAPACPFWSFFHYYYYYITPHCVRLLFSPFCLHFPPKKLLSHTDTHTHAVSPVFSLPPPPTYHLPPPASLVECNRSAERLRQFLNQQKPTGKSPPPSTYCVMGRRKEKQGAMMGEASASLSHLRRTWNPSRRGNLF